MKLKGRTNQEGVITKLLMERYDLLKRRIRKVENAGEAEKCKVL